MRSVKRYRSLKNDDSRGAAHVVFVRTTFGSPEPAGRGGCIVEEAEAVRAHERNGQSALSGRGTVRCDVDETVP